MTVHTVSADRTTPIVAGIMDDIWVVKVNVDVATTGDTIDASGSITDMTFLIYGNLIADGGGDGINLDNGGYNRVQIFSSGSIFAESSAIESSGGFLKLNNAGSLFSVIQPIFAADGNNYIINTGTVTSSNSCIVASGGQNTVSNGGVVAAASTGINVNGGFSQVTNTGIITSANGSGILASGDDNTISNAGGITALLDGIYASGAGNLIVNSGSVVSANNSVIHGAVGFHSSSGENNRLFNSGELSSQLNAVYGGAGNETIINRGAMNGNVDLGAGYDSFKGWSGTVDGTIHGRGGNDTIAGGISDNAIFGDGGADVLKGGQGDDTLTGGSGRDLMRGGPDFDTFDFNNTTDSAAGAQRDHILDFSKADDVIDLAGIDAKTGVAGNQAFHFIGSTAFSGTAGELRAFNSAANAIVAGDVDGDGHSDFSILVEDVRNLHAGDFML